MFVIANLTEYPDLLDTDKAIITLSPANAKQLLERQDRVVAQKKVDVTLYCHEFFDDQCSFVSERDLCEVTPKADDLEQEGVVSLTGNAKVAGKVSQFTCPHLDCHTVVITETDFTWTALTRHDSRLVKTVPIPRAFLELAVKEGARTQRGRRP
jgi:hypothetical protein